MAFYYSRRKLKPREEEESGELNIIPYLDILMNLILFMLLSINGLAAFGIVNVSAPGYGGPSTSVAPQENPEQPRLVLSVLISKKGHFINSENAILGQDGAPTVPLGTDGAYDYASLNAQMVKIKSAFPTETKVIVAADPEIPYDTLIQTMDAIRETREKPHRELFPDVTLGAL
ncbi:biopolymer transport protein ExbD [Archangium gephyra]|uniref:Biopolymer transport protein ExbD n=1 Tax=Archangium gephyra TaxID=48 RepID=A0AAC8TGC3_9BACT|nr:biopolymer transporter ExbD [Archangium gephyra]AKJ05037.1 TolR-like protein [Archangium gephyra]REG35740.1 biopolymer transport protein ExbD [Archangium gephyra]